MEAIMNKEGLKIFSHFLSKIEKIKEWREIEIYFFKDGSMKILTGGTNNSLMTGQMFLDKELFDEMDIKDDVVYIRTFVDRIQHFFSKTQSFDTAIFDVKNNDLKIKLSNDAGTVTEIVLPTIASEDGPFQQTNLGKIYKLDHYEFKIKPKVLKDIVFLCKKNVDNDDRFYIEKSDDVLTMYTYVDRNKSKFTLVNGESNDLYWLNGVDGSLVTHFESFSNGINFLIDEDAKFIVVPDAAVVIHQLSDNYMLALGLSAQREPEIENEYDDDEYE